MEKADILEMAVKHLKQMQRQQTNDSFQDASVINKYALGFNACVQEVNRYLGEDVELKTRLLTHLDNCMIFQSPGSCSSKSSGLGSPARAMTSTPMSPLSIGTMSPTSTTQSPDNQRNMQLDFKNVSPSSSVKNLEFSPQTGSDDRRLNTSAAQSIEFQAISSPIKVEDVQKFIVPSTLPSTSSSTQNSFSMFLNSPQVYFNRSVITDVNNNNSNQGNGKISHDGNESVVMGEVNNNNLLTIPTVIGLRGSSALQQPLQIQPVQQFQTMPTGITVDQQQAVLPDPGILANRLQLIPMKMSSGETAYILSAANFVNPSQLPGYSVQVYTPQNQAPVFAQSFQQQPVQIAFAVPHDDHNQNVTYVSPTNPLLTSVMEPASMRPVAGTTDNQCVPLNLTASTHKLVQQRCSPRSSPYPSRFSARTPESFPSVRTAEDLPEQTFLSHRDHPIAGYSQINSRAVTPPLRSESGVPCQANSSIAQPPCTINPSSYHSYLREDILSSMVMNSDVSSRSLSAYDHLVSSNGIHDRSEQVRGNEYRQNIHKFMDTKSANFFRPW